MLDENELLMDQPADLDSIAEVYDPSSPQKDFDYWFVRLGFETLRAFLKGPTALELGCSTGLMTSLLSPLVQRLVVVDGSAANLAAARQRVGGARHVTFLHQGWEEFQPQGPFDDVLLVRGLEHVDDPISLLKRIRGWLTQGGRLHVIVPNALSLHRRIGLYMGLLQDLHELHEGDLRVGHRRVYDRQMLLHHLGSAGFVPTHCQGILLKPLSNQQMQAWPEALVRAFYRAGLELPDYCGEVYACCTLADQ